MTSSDNLLTPRTRNLMRTIVGDRLELDLSGFKVITEAGTGPYAVTASLAALAGAEVDAVANDADFGSFDQAAQDTMDVAELCDVAAHVRVATRGQADFESAMVVTNLGHVKPFNRELIARLPEGAVIPTMCDIREFPYDEIDLGACERHRVSVVGTWEDHPLVDVLRYAGPLAMKLLFEEGLEVAGNFVVIAGNDLFAPPIARSLVAMGADVHQLKEWEELAQVPPGRIDVLLYSDYHQEMGRPMIDQAVLQRQVGSSLLQFTGGLELMPFIQAAWRLVPEQSLPAHTLWRPLAHLGVRPVIELHAAGLKAAELMLKSVPFDGSSPFAGLRQQIHSNSPVGKTPA